MLKIFPLVTRILFRPVEVTLEDSVLIRLGLDRGSKQKTFGETRGGTRTGGVW